MKTRNYQEQNLKEIIDLFYNTVHSVNLKNYTQEQVDAWATKNIDLNEWGKSLLKNNTVVVTEGAQIVGFGDIDESCYINRLYVHKDHQGKGIATNICNELEKQAGENCIYVHASITAKGFFEKRDYQVLKEQQVERNSVFLTNYIMMRSVKPNLCIS